MAADGIDAHHGILDCRSRQIGNKLTGRNAEVGGEKVPSNDTESNDSRKRNEQAKDQRPGNSVQHDPGGGRSRLGVSLYGVSVWFLSQMKAWLLPALK